MSVLKFPLLFKGSNGERVLYALFDSGSHFSCINEEYAKDLGKPETLNNIHTVSTAAEGQFLLIKEIMKLDFFINDSSLSDDFLVVPGLSEQVIIGAATFQRWKIKLDFDYDCVFVDSKIASLQLKKE